MSGVPPAWWDELALETAREIHCLFDPEIGDGWTQRLARIQAAILACMDAARSAGASSADAVRRHAEAPAGASSEGRAEPAALTSPLRANTDQTR